MGGYAELSLVRSLSFLAEYQATIANNLANADSGAFRRRIAFAEPATETFQSTLEQKLGTLRYAQAGDWSPGTVKTTQERFHVALASDDGARDLFFRVRGARGETLYTRSGDLRIDVQNRLTTPGGLPYLDPAGQEIRVESLTDLRIAPNGQISDTDPESRQVVPRGQLGVWRVADLEALAPVGAGAFRDTRNQNPAPSAEPALRQGYLEGSNVNVVQEMVAMLAVERSYQGTARALTAVSRMQDSYVNAMNR